jgi:hypothetical protein
MMGMTLHQLRLRERLGVVQGFVVLVVVFLALSA